MSISELFRYWKDSFQSDIFSSYIGIIDVDVGCRISPTIRSMSMPTYGYKPSPPWCAVTLSHLAAYSSMMHSSLGAVQTNVRLDT
jgi:hypothetical protein